MVILLIHNFYQRPGGEDARVRQERDLLVSNGHRVIEYPAKAAKLRSTVSPAVSASESAPFGRSELTASLARSSLGSGPMWPIFTIRCR